MLGRLTVSLINTNRTTEGAAALGARAKDRAMDAAAQAIPVGKRAGATAVQGVRQGVQDAREWAAPRIEQAVYDAREWAAPRIDDAADAVTTTVAPKVSSALHATAEQVRPADLEKTGVRQLLSWRWLLAAGVALAAAGAGAAVAMRRRYASATEEAKNATESPVDDRAAQDGESADTAIGSEVNGRVSSSGT
jgi:hypothetical protein